MQKEFLYRSLTPEDHEQMHQAFSAVYKDTPLSYTMSKERFIQKYLGKHNLRYDLSVGAFDGDKLIGFIFSSVAKYEGKLTAFNSGGGVLEEYRGKFISRHMYDFLIPKFKEEGVKQCLMEVIRNDQRVMNLSKKLGFSLHKTYHCFILKNVDKLKMHAPLGISIRLWDKPDWELFESFGNLNASFMDSQDHLDQNQYEEKVIVARKEDEIIGFAVFEADIGRISQIAVRPENRGKGVGEAMLSFIYQMSANKQLVINVDSKAIREKEYFEKIGFANIVDLCEMIMPI